jgi:murein DD-endopeptidase MepM/ murein hydrolase activator NlpD
VKSFPATRLSHPRLISRQRAAVDPWDDLETGVWVRAAVGANEDDTERDIPLGLVDLPVPIESLPPLPRPLPKPPATRPALVRVAPPPRPRTMTPPSVIVAPMRPLSEPLARYDEQPLARFEDARPRRAATAVEPMVPIGMRMAAPQRAITYAIAGAAAAAAAIVLLAGYQVYRNQFPEQKHIALAEPEPTADDELLPHVAVSAEESSRIFHRTSAALRDRWRSAVWYHPLSNELRLPENLTRKFGARRSGKRPVECGRGHCGVDLGYFGLVVRAARDGVVEKVQRRAKDRAGRYLRIAHDDGFVSYYIHLHRIRADLEEGMTVKGGEPIGVTGKTGIRRSRPHLHFALAIKDGKEKVFVDPEPLLRRSVAVSGDADQVASQ